MARPPASHLEVEWQFAVRDVAGFERWLARARFADGWSLSRSATLRLQDAYYDSPDWRVWRAGYALRVRRSGERVEATLKARRRARGGVARRREITERLDDARLRSLRLATGVVGARLRRMLGTSKLGRLFALRTLRRTFVLQYEGRGVGEIALDRTRVLAHRGRSRRLERVEVEVAAGPPVLVERFVRTLRRKRHLTIAARSKFEEGLTAAGRVPPRPR